MKVLENIAIEFEEIANTCLLVLHLEVRVQCFHYLRSNEKNAKFIKIANDSLEPDSKVLKLTKVLSEMDEALNATLHPRKTKVGLDCNLKSQMLWQIKLTYGLFIFIIYANFSMSLKGWHIWPPVF